MTRDCQQVRELLDSFLSSELAVETNHSILRHVEQCDACRSEVDRRRETRRLLSSALRDAADAGDVEGLRLRIATAIERDGGLRWRRAARFWPLAAALVLAVSAALWWPRPVDAAAFDDSADNHVACALTYPPNAYDADRIKQAMTGPFAGLVDALAREYAGYELVDAHLCPYKGRDYAHVIYRSDGHLVSVFAEPSARGALPQAEHVATVPDGPAVMATASHGYLVDSIATRDHHVFVVSEEGWSISPAARDGILASAARFMRTIEER